MNAVFAMAGWRFGFWGKERELPVWLACFSSGGVGSGGFLCWRRGMGGFFGGWRAIWLGTHGFGGRVLCCWGDVEAAVVAAGLASRGRMGIAGVACLFRLRWSWFRRLLRWRRRSGRFGGGERTFSEGLYGRFCKKVETAAQWQVWPGAAGFDVGDRGLFTGAGWKVVRRGSKYGSETGARGAALAGSVWLRRRFWVRRRGAGGLEMGGVLRARGFFAANGAGRVRGRGSGGNWRGNGWLLVRERILW